MKSKIIYVFGIFILSMICLLILNTKNNNSPIAKEVLNVNKDIIADEYGDLLKRFSVVESNSLQKKYEVKYFSPGYNSERGAEIYKYYDNGKNIVKKFIINNSYSQRLVWVYLVDSKIYISEYINVFRFVDGKETGFDEYSQFNQYFFDNNDLKEIRVNGSILKKENYKDFNVNIDILDTLDTFESSAIQMKV